MQRTGESGHDVFIDHHVRLPLTMTLAKIPLLSDTRLALARALRLPTFAFAGLELIKRLTIIIRAGRIEEVFYPVFPSDADAERVVAWLIG